MQAVKLLLGSIIHSLVMSHSALVASHYTDCLQPSMTVTASSSQGKQVRLQLM
jgi:hypothetical protein